jgi:hypothetical protein
LTHKSIIVSVTSRNTKGADLLATNLSFKKTWTIQVKTNRKAAKRWLLNKNYKDDVSEGHIYIFVRGDQ